MSNEFQNEMMQRSPSWRNYLKGGADAIGPILSARAAGELA